jgi:prevent-host-death family protein
LTGQLGTAIIAIMKTANITEAKNQLSSFIEAVKHGESVLILDRSVPVARLEPIDPNALPAGAEHLAQLERKGLLRRGTAKLPPDFLQHVLPAQSDGAPSIVEALCRDREEGR